MDLTEVFNLEAGDRLNDMVAKYFFNMPLVKLVQKKECITHDMATDAENPELEGMPWQEAEYQKIQAPPFSQDMGYAWAIVKELYKRGYSTTIYYEADDDNVFVDVEDLDNSQSLSIEDPDRVAEGICKLALLTLTWKKEERFIDNEEDID